MSNTICTAIVLTGPPFKQGPSPSVEYNMYSNSIDINHYTGYILHIDCSVAENGLHTTPNSQRLLNALAVDNPLEYVRLYLNHEMQIWIDAENSIEIF